MIVFIIEIIARIADPSASEPPCVTSPLHSDFLSNVISKMVFFSGLPNWHAEIPLLCSLKIPVAGCARGYELRHCHYEEKVPKAMPNVKHAK